MLNYIKKLNDNSLYISKNHNVIIIDTTFQKYINQYLNKNFTTIKTAEKSIKKQLGFKSKIPIYIDKYNLLMCIKSYRLEKSFYINYKSIYHYEIKNNYIYISFVNHHQMKITEKSAFISQLNKCQKIIDYIND
ncbi:hypothetical protein ACAG96_03835 [Candidatus Izemoplasma sp. B36]|uniref:hypothetical protein n=1 Tax=Candidatus Izemoplasma sp. B36 TaxID=3242468 RepID=UPI00355757A4